MTRTGLVLAGGRSSRMGRAKQGLLRDGRTLVQAAVDACLTVGCERVAVVAPDDQAAGWLEAHDRVSVTLEDPPLGGPVAGIAAGLSSLAPSPDDEVLLFACDLPGVGAVAEALVAEPLDDEVVVPVDDEGWPQWLAARYPAGMLVTAVLGMPSRDASVNRTMRELPRHELRLAAELVADVDTPEQARRAGLAGFADADPDVTA